MLQFSLGLTKSATPWETQSLRQANGSTLLLNVRQVGDCLGQAGAERTLVACALTSFV